MAARSSTPRKALAGNNKTAPKGRANIGLDGQVAIRNPAQTESGLKTGTKGQISQMQDIAELERRITAAIERITKGVDRLAAERPDTGAEFAQLTEALEEERMTNAQLNERIRVLRDRLAANAGPEAPAADTETLSKRIAAQDEELATLRRVLAEAGKEIAALRAARAAEAAELAEIKAALDPLIAEAPHA